MRVRIDFHYIKHCSAIATAEMEEKEFDAFKKELELIPLDSLLNRYGFKVVEVDCGDPDELCVTDATLEKYYGLLTVDENFSWKLEYVTQNRNFIVQDFTKRIEEKEDILESEGFDYAIFEDGSELWVIELSGKPIIGHLGYALIYEDSEGFKGASVFGSLRDAQAELELIIKEYEDEGFELEHRTDDIAEFSNDDVWKLQKVEIKEERRKT